MKSYYILWQGTIYIAKYFGIQFEDEISIIYKQILIFNASFNDFH